MRSTICGKECSTVCERIDKDGHTVPWQPEPCRQQTSTPQTPTTSIQVVVSPARAAPPAAARCQSSAAPAGRA